MRTICLLREQAAPRVTVAPPSPPPPPPPPHLSPSSPSPPSPLPLNDDQDEDKDDAKYGGKAHIHPGTFAKDFGANMQNLLLRGMRLLTN